MAKNEFSCDCSIIHQDAVSRVRDSMLTQSEFDRVTTFFKVLGDGTRLKMIWALSKQELCVCDIANVLNMTKSAVSHQLHTLRDADLVRCRRDGKTVYYSLADGHIRQMLCSGVEHINN